MRLIRWFRAWLGASLRRRILAASLAPALFFMFILGGLSLYFAQIALGNEINQRNTQLAAVIAHDLQTQFDGILNTMRQLSYPEDLSADPLVVHVDTMLEMRRAFPITYHALYLFASDCQLLVSIPDHLETLQDLSIAEVISRVTTPVAGEILSACTATLGGDNFISGVHLDVTDQVPYVYAGVAAMHGDGQAGHILVAEIDLRFVWRLVDEVRVGQTGQAFVVSGEGEIIAYPDRTAIGRKLPLEMAQVLAGYEGYTRYIDPLSDRVLLAAYSPVGLPSGWGVVVEQEQTEAFALVGTLLLVALATLLVAMTITVVTNTLTARSITRPVQHLEETTRTIALTGDLSRNVAVETADEIGRLAATFNQMVASLRQSAGVLKESEERFRSIFEQAAVGISQLAPTGHFLHVNQRYSDILGYTKEEILALTFQEITFPDDLEADLEFVAETLADKRQSFTMEKRLIRKDGSLVWVKLTVGLVRTPTREAKYFVSVVEDITQRKRTEEELRRHQAHMEELVTGRTAELSERVTEVEQLNRALGNLLEDLQAANRNLERAKRQTEAVNKELETFAYSVSHDLRAPLRALDGFSAALLSRFADQLDEQGSHYLERIQEASRHMGQLINDLLDLSRVTRREMTRQPVDLSALAREIATELQASEAHRQVEFIIGSQMTAQGDAHLLRIALENLMNNAWKFTHPREKTRIEVGQMTVDDFRLIISDCRSPDAAQSEMPKPESAIFFVCDNGVGFDMAYADKLFSPFQRLHAAQAFPGTGIGLATVQRIIARHGGRIWVKAQVDQGATFYFQI